ncbi:unnamed protein product [Protopolystoma xenopodis]|uniref:Uncharacterized protein n=1 Tax=Protopolystoma xenopodis TaxID=117903 RepID=A0A448WUE1_9PLAT|nr:unnamed protein product [Protopolystoma xenopodis]
MKLTLALCRGKRIYRDPTAKLMAIHWWKRGSLAKVDRYRVHYDVLRRLPKASTSFLPDEAKIEDTFFSSRYDEELTRETVITPCAVSEAKALLQAQKAREAELWSGHAGDPRYRVGEAAQRVGPTLLFVEQRRFTKDLDQASILANVSWY